MTTVSTIHVQIGEEEPSLTPGQSYTLTCSVVGASDVIYQWMRDGSILQGETTGNLSFSPLRLSHAGQYTCEVFVDCVAYTDDVAVTIASNILHIINDIS